MAQTSSKPQSNLGAPHASAQRAEPSPAPTPAANKDREPNLADRVIGQTRLIAIIPAGGLAFCAFILVIGTVIDVVGTTIEYIAGNDTLDNLTIEYIEYTDMFLLGVVLFMTALGLATLFITNKVPLPHWLEFHDLDDLKERLVSVIVVMLGVHFLGMVLKGTSAMELLWLGIGICVVIFALTIFTRAIFKSNGEHNTTPKS